jgi:CheY-like chemotaxis protein
LTTVASSRAQILIVEDDAEVLEAMSEALMEEGYAVATAKNGQEALDYLDRSLAPDLIILDLTMPVMDGREFLERRRRRSDLAVVPVMVVSATTDARLHTQGVQVLRKPVDLDVLLDNIARHVS